MFFVRGDTEHALNSNSAYNKKKCIIFFFGGISFEGVVTRRENSFFAYSVIFFFLQIFT